MAQALEDATTVGVADVKAVLEGLRQFIIARLSEGQTIELEELGTWSVSPVGWVVTHHTAQKNKGGA